MPEAKMRTLKCVHCGEVVAGPDPKSVDETMARHQAQKHPPKVAKK